MRRSIKLLLIGFFLFSNKVEGQVVVNSHLPAAGLIQKQQLLSFTLVNSSFADIDVAISLVVKEKNSGLILLSATSRPLKLNPGIKIVSQRDFRGLQYSSELTQSGFLPIGEYVACYTITKTTDKNDLILSECTSFSVSPLSPILLQYPESGTTLQPNPGKFSWIAPSPVKLFKIIRYELNIVEILEGQSPKDAFTHNVPLYHKRGLSATNDFYPVSGKPLASGRNYAWQVVATTGSGILQSEIWTFSIAKDSTEQLKKENSYLELTTEYEKAGVAELVEKRVNLKYYSFAPIKHGEVSILDSHGNLVKSFKKSFSYGDNYFTLHLPKSVDNGKVYEIRVSNDNNIFKAYFIIK